VEERAKIRNQPVVLTRQGATWIRRVCGASSSDDGSDKKVDDDGDQADDVGVAVEEEEEDESNFDRAREDIAEGVSG